MFQTSISKSDWQSLQKFNSAIKVTNDGLTKSQRITKAWNENMTGCSMAAKRMGNDLITGKQKIGDVSNSMKTATASTKALGVAMNVFANVGFMLAITAISKVVSELAQAQENAVQAAKEATEVYNNEISSIDDYKTKLSELHEELNSGNLSYEETKTKRTELMSIQDELIEKFCTEKGAIESVTEAINGQVDALDALNEKSYRDWVAKADEQTFWNQLLPGDKSGLDQAIDYMETDQTVSFYDMQNANLSDELQAIQKEIDETIKAKYNLDKTFAMFNVTGRPDEIKEQLDNILQDYMDLSKDVFTEKGIDSSLWDDYRKEVVDSINKAKNEVDKGLNDHQETYQTYIEGLIKYDSEYSDEYANILQKRAELESAQNSGNKEEIQKTRQAFMDAINKGIKESGSNENIRKYFESLYPELQAEFSDWAFEFDLKANVKGLKDVANEIGEKYTATDLLGMVDDDSTVIADSAFNFLIDKAIEYGICTDKSAEEVQKLIDLLVELGIVQDNVKGNTFNNEIANQWDFSETISQLDTAKSKLSVLDETFSKIFDTDADTNIGFEDYSAIFEAFKDVEGLDISNFVQQLQDAGQDVEKVTSVMQDLIGSYLEHSQILDNVTNENKEFIITMLEEMGVVNAEEIVLANLSTQTEVLSLQKQFNTEKGYELVNATLEEINAFINEVNASAEAERALAQLALEKINVNNNPINTSEDIANVIALANAANASAKAIATLKEAQNAVKSNSITRQEWGQSILNQINNGTFDYGYTKLDPTDFQVKSYTPTYSGGSATQKAIKDTADEVSKAAEKVQEQFEETFDFFDERVEELDNAIELLEANLENVSGSFAKNTLIDAEIDISKEKINNYTDALAMYTEKANEALSKLPSDIAEKVKNGAVDLTTFIGDGNKDIVEAIKEYDQWSDSITSCKQELAELQQTLEDLQLAKFTNIMDDFNNQFDIREGGKDLIDQAKKWIEESGSLVGDSFFSSSIDQSKKQLALLEEEKKQLVNQLTSALSSGHIKIGSDAWIEMTNSLTDVEKSIYSVKTEIEELDTELQNLHWENVDRISEKFSNLSDEINNLIGLIDDVDVSDKDGNWSKEGLTQIGLYAQEYEKAVYASQMYAEEIEHLNKEYLAGKYSLLEYQERLASLTEEQWNHINASESALDAIKELNGQRIDIQIEGIEEEISAYEELINSKIEALQAEKDLHDYRESISEKTKSVTDLERQIAAMQNDDTASTVAKRKQLEEQLSEERKELEETEYDHSVESQIDALNKQYDDYEKTRNDEIEALKATLDNEEALIAQSFETVKQNASLVGEQITQIAQEHGVYVSDALITSWQQGENAIASYGTVLSAQSSAFIGNIMGVENEVWNLQAQANMTADSLAWMFSTRADNLVNELANSYYSEQNLNAMTHALQDSLINTLERGYNVSGITSGLNSIASAANSAAEATSRAAQALSQLGAKGTLYKLSGVAGGTITSYNKSDLEKLAKSYGKGTVIPAYASGTRSTKSELIVTDEEGGELKLPKLSSGNYTIAPEGTQILTKKQTDMLYEWSKLNPEMFIPQSVKNTVANVTTMPNVVTRNVSQPVSVHYDSFLTVNGDINDTNHFIGQVERIATKVAVTEDTKNAKKILSAISH